MSEKEIIPDRPAILIADDEESIRLVVKAVLGNYYTVLEAENGEEAIRTTLINKPSLILMDNVMPVKDGIQACQEIKSNPETREIPIVMVTGFGNADDQQYVLKYGLSGYITKPFTTQELIDIVQKIMNTIPN
jgi:CheY-like chemotaxis protein